MLEDGDLVRPRPDGSEVEIALALDPIVTPRRASSGARVRIWDKDEIVITGGASPSLELAPETPALAYALGTHARLRPLEPIDLESVRAAATVPSHAVVQCNHPDGSGRTPVRQPHLRIWHVDRPQAVDPAAVDPALAERLRVLGYAWPPRERE